MRSIWTWCAAGIAALAVTGCGDRAERTERADAEPATPASYDALTSDRTRGRDEEPTTSAAPDGVGVQDAYERVRADERASGRLGTDGEAARAAGAGAPGEGELGGTSAGTEAPAPYAGSRTIDARPYPGVPAARAPREQEPAPAQRPSRPGPANDRGIDDRPFGIPYAPDEGASTAPMPRGGDLPGSSRSGTSSGAERDPRPVDDAREPALGQPSAVDGAYPSYDLDQDRR